MKTSSRRILATFATATTVFSGLAVAPVAQADPSSGGSKAAAIAKIDVNLDSLQTQAGELGGQISDVNGEIGELEQEYSKLLPKLAHKQRLLSETIKESYIAGEPSSVEVLASNQTFSGVVSQQHYRDEINVKTDRIARELGEVKDALADKLDSAKEKRQGLLSLKGQLDERVATAEAQEAAREAAAALSEKQFAAAQKANESAEAGGIARNPSSPTSSPGGGGTPQPIGGGRGGNPYPFGQCTWYVYDQTGRGQMGNAGTWAPSSSTPGVGKIMIWRPGEAGATGAGHVGVVIGVRGNMVTVRHMNWNGFGVVSTGNFRSTGKFY